MIKKQDMKYKTLFYLFAGLSLILLTWNIYIFSNISKIQDQLEMTTREKNDAKGFNEVLEYDLGAYKDSVLILKEQIEGLKKE